MNFHHKINITLSAILNNESINRLFQGTFEILVLTPDMNRTNNLKFTFLIAYQTKRQAVSQQPAVTT